MKYVFILVAKSGTEPAFGTDEWKEYAAEYGRFNEDAAKAGVLQGGDPIQPPVSSTTVRVAGEGVKIVNAPFAELAEQIIGYYVFECADLNDATYWAAKIPVAARGIGAVEIRPVVDFS